MYTDQCEIDTQIMFELNKHTHKRTKEKEDFTDIYKNRKTNNVQLGKTLVETIHGQTN